MHQLEARASSMSLKKERSDYMQHNTQYTRCIEEHHKSLHLASSAYCRAVVTAETYDSTEPRETRDEKQQPGAQVLKPSAGKLLAVHKV